MNAAIYARKSTEQRNADEEAKSVTRQIENARAFAKAQGWRVSAQHVYNDDAISGADTKKLVNRQRLLDALAADSPPFQVLIMRDESRFSRRDGDEAFGELKRIAQAGIEVWFYQDATRFTFGTFGANIVGFVRAEMAAEYRRQVARWTREALVRKAKAGHVTGGRVFGYDNLKIDGHTERRINAAEAVVVRRIFDLSVAGSGYTRIAKQLNTEHALTPRSQQGRPRAWSPSSVYEVLHRPLYVGELIWNRTRKRDAEGRIASTARPEAEWLRLDRPDLRIVSGKTWEAVHTRLDTARAQYERQTYGRRQYRRDQDSKYLLTGFGRCAVCGGGLHVRSHASGVRRVFFYACSSHYNRGSEVCPHVDKWPMEELDREVIASIMEDVLRPQLAEEVVAEAARLFAASQRADHDEQWRLELAAVEREHARLTEAIATGTEAIPVLVERLRAADLKRRELRMRARRPSPPRWREIERRLRRRLTECRSTLAGDVPEARQAFRAASCSIQFTPTVERGYRAIQFEGRWNLETVLGGEMVMNLASPRGPTIDYRPTFQGIWRSDRPAA